MITENLTQLKINKLTQAQYDAARVAGTLNENELYMTPDTNELDTTSFIRVSDVGSAVDPNPINADTLGGKASTEFFSTADGQALNNSKAPKASPVFTGTPKTSANTNYTTAQLRNVILSTAEPTASNGSNGDIWIKYKA